MKLILTRHAKSDWSDPLLDDHDRVLNPRGRTAAAQIGGWIEAQGHAPLQALCSTAARARETCDLICQNLSDAPDVTYSEALYHASGDAILASLRKAKQQPLLVVGHNPGFGHLAAMLVRERPEHREFIRYPTAATLVLEFDIKDWTDVRPEHGRVVDFIVPRDLA